MKRFRVLIATTADIELEEAYQFIRAHSPERARRWRRSILDAAGSLESSPARCGFAPENGLHGLKIRQRIHGNYRLVFIIQGKDVVVLHVRHASRGTIPPDELLPPYLN